MSAEKIVRGRPIDPLEILSRIDAISEEDIAATRSKVVLPERFRSFFDECDEREKRFLATVVKLTDDEIQSIFSEQEYNFGVHELKNYITLLGEITGDARYFKKE